MDVKDKIAKLLALAGNNTSEEEAKAALLRARELMAAHKLRPEECNRGDEPKVITSLVGISCTGRKNTWAINLSAIIAKHYCCVSYRNHKKHTQTYAIGFVGLEDDFEICSRIFRYAFECVEATSAEVFRQDDDWYDAAQRRKNAEAYGWAFCAGLKKAFEAQQSEHQEWGLVMVVPKEVRETELGRMKPTPMFDAQCDRVLGDSTHEAKMRGYNDGLKFDPATKLTEAKSPLALNA